MNRYDNVAVVETLRQRGFSAVEIRRLQAFRRQYLKHTSDPRQLDPHRLAFASYLVLHGKLSEVDL